MGLVATFGKDKGIRIFKQERNDGKFQSADFVFRQFVPKNIYFDLFYKEHLSRKVGKHNCETEQPLVIPLGEEFKIFEDLMIRPYQFVPGHNEVRFYITNDGRWEMFAGDFFSGLFVPLNLLEYLSACKSEFYPALDSDMLLYKRVIDWKERSERRVHHI